MNFVDPAMSCLYPPHFPELYYDTYLLQKRRWTRRIGLPFSRLFRRKNKQKRYEKMGREDSCDAKESCYQRGSQGKKMSGANEKVRYGFCVSTTTIYTNSK